MASSVPTSIPRFFDENERPAQGGWHYYEDPARASTYFRLYSPGDVFEHVKKLRQNNGTFVSDVDIWRELWNYWCSREPGRCGLATPAAPAGPVKPRELNAAMWGPIIWMALNLHAVRFDSIGKENFLRFIGTISSLMTCPECIAHWQEIVASMPPGTVSNASEACHWVNAAHDRVNAARGVASYPYSRMVLEYGAPAE